LPARRNWPSGDRAAKKRDELAPSQFIELHSIPPAKAALQDIEWAGIGQRVSARRLYVAAHPLPVSKFHLLIVEFTSPTVNPFREQRRALEQARIEQKSKKSRFGKK
jgi:hypothetical protein